MDAARSTSNEWLLPIEFIQVVLDIDNTTYENLVRDGFQYFVFPHLRSEESSQQFDTLFPMLSKTDFKKKNKCCLLESTCNVNLVYK